MIYKRKSCEGDFFMENKNSLLVYDNHINTIRLTGFSALDRDIFMLVLKAFMDKDTTEISLSFRDMMSMMKVKGMTLSQFTSRLLELREPIRKASMIYTTPTRVFDGALFPTFDVDFEKKTLFIRINEDCKELFNNLTQNFTSLDILAFLSLQSKYSKTLYQMLSQFKNTGWWKVGIDDFLDIFDIRYKHENSEESASVPKPTIYVNNKKKIMDNIIKPSIKELAPFMDITCTSITDEHKRGKPLIGYEFKVKEVLHSFVENNGTDKDELLLLSNDDISVRISQTEDTELLDKIISIIDGYSFNIGAKSTLSLATKAIQMNRNEQYVDEACRIAKSQDCDNVGAKLMHFIINGYDVPHKSSKKTSFGNIATHHYTDDIYNSFLAVNQKS